jgi:hypothetical protein
MINLWPFANISVLLPRVADHALRVGDQLVVDPAVVMASKHVEQHG